MVEHSSWMQWIQNGLGWFMKNLWPILTKNITEFFKKNLIIIFQNNGSYWYLGCSSGKPSMQVVCDWHINNISDNSIKICETFIIKPKTIGGTLVRHLNQDIYGSYFIPPHVTTKASSVFWITPPVQKENESLIIDVEFIDNFGKHYKIKKNKLSPRPKSQDKKVSLPSELPSDISDPIEKEVVTVLQAELNRYKECGRRAGGLGSIQTFYNGQTYAGVGTDCRVANSPALQSIVPDPENAKIESDNAQALTEFYKTLKDQRQKIFVDSLLRRLLKNNTYSSASYFILFVLYRVGYFKEALNKAKEDLQGDSEHGFSNFLILLDGLLKYEYSKFSQKMLDDTEQFLKDINEYAFRIHERILAARTFLLAKRAKRETIKRI